MFLQLNKTVRTRIILINLYFEVLVMNVIFEEQIVLIIMGLLLLLAGVVMDQMVGVLSDVVLMVVHGLCHMKGCEGLVGW